MSSYGITDFFTYLIGLIGIVILPGPNSMYCLFVASARGVIDGYKAAAGIFLGDLVLMLAAVFGAAAVLKTNPNVFFVFKVLGGLYLAYLGVNLLFGAYRRYIQGKPATEGANQSDISGIVDTGKKTRVKKNLAKNENVFFKALILSLSNPKAILFILSFFLQFVDPNYDNPMLSFFILGLALQVVSMVYLSTLIFTGTKLSAFFSRQYVLSSVGNAVVGLLFISFAVSLWTSRV